MMNSSGGYRAIVYAAILALLPLAVLSTEAPLRCPAPPHTIHVKYGVSTARMAWPDSEIAARKKFFERMVDDALSRGAENSREELYEMFVTRNIEQLTKKDTVKTELECWTDGEQFLYIFASPKDGESKVIGYTRALTFAGTPAALFPGADAKREAAGKDVYEITAQMQDDRTPQINIYPGPFASHIDTQSLMRQIPYLGYCQPGTPLYQYDPCDVQHDGQSTVFRVIYSDNGAGEEGPTSAYRIMYDAAGRMQSMQVYQASSRTEMGILEYEYRFDDYTPLTQGVDYPAKITQTTYNPREGGGTFPYARIEYTALVADTNPPVHAYALPQHPAHGTTVLDWRYHNHLPDCVYAFYQYNDTRRSLDEASEAALRARGNVSP